MDSKTLTTHSQFFCSLGSGKKKCFLPSYLLFVFLFPRMSRNLSFTILFLFVHRHIENWTGLQTLRDVDMELYTGLQRLWVLTLLSKRDWGVTSDRHFTVFQTYCVADLEKDSGTWTAGNPCFPSGFPPAHCRAANAFLPKMRAVFQLRTQVAAAPASPAMHRDLMSDTS